MIDNPVVMSFLINVVGDESNLPVVKCLVNGIKTDEEIAEKTEIRLNIVRKVLYKLYDFGLASYKRSKDPETQWYTYAWEFEEEEVAKFMKKEAEKQIKYYKNLLEEEENNIFFVCPQGHARYDYNTASELQFACEYCGEQVEFQDNEQLIKQIKEDIKICERNFKTFNKMTTN